MVSDPPGAAVADRVGATASLLCALHCALLPLLLAALPALGLGFLGEHWFEAAFTGFAIVLASTTLLLGWRRHRRWQALALLVPGVLALLAGLALHGTGLVHAVLLATGGTLVALGHLVNLRLGHGPHRHRPGCMHCSQALP